MKEYSSCFSFTAKIVILSETQPIKTKKLDNQFYPAFTPIIYNEKKLKRQILHKVKSFHEIQDKLLFGKRPNLKLSSSENQGNSNNNSYDIGNDRIKFRQININESYTFDDSSISETDGTNSETLNENNELLNEINELKNTNINLNHNTSNKKSKVSRKRKLYQPS